MDLKMLRHHLDILDTCLVEAPIDFLGTGGLGSRPDKEEREWNKSWQESIKAIEELIEEEETLQQTK